MRRAMALIRILWRTIVSAGWIRNLSKV
jgi:hypothetical protein